MTDDELERAMRLAAPHDLAPGFAARTARRIGDKKVVHPLEGLVCMALAVTVLMVTAGPLGRIIEGTPARPVIALAVFFSMLVLERLLAGMSFPKKRYPRSAR